MTDKSSKPKYQLEIRRELCIGVANCIVLAPNAFELDHKNIAVLKKDWQKMPAEKLLAAAESCPVAAIVVKDKKTGQQIYP